jgi:hypothetical protein
MKSVGAGREEAREVPGRGTVAYRDRPLDISGTMSNLADPGAISIALEMPAQERQLKKFAWNVSRLFSRAGRPRPGRSTEFGYVRYC